MIGAAIILLVGIPAQACTVGSEFEPRVCPAQLPAVRSVTITANGQTSWADRDDKDCETFNLNEHQVRDYLAKAGKVDPHDAHYTLSESPCHASGTARFADGSSGAWWIDQFRRGGLTRPGQPDMMLYCPRCRTKPFTW